MLCCGVLAGSVWCGAVAWCVVPCVCVGWVMLDWCGCMLGDGWLCVDCVRSSVC